MNAQWLSHFPELQQAAADDPAISDLLQHAKKVSLPAATTVFHQGDHCAHYILVLQGEVKVLTSDINGREIVLYRLTSGDSCVLTTSCLFGETDYPAEGITETDVDAILIPASVFQQTVQHSADFRRFVFASFGGHLGSLISLVTEVAFGKIHSRLAKHLLDHSDSDGHLIITHQQLATELGTAREVVSRQLKEFERHGQVELHRGSIHIADRESLVQLASS